MKSILLNQIAAQSIWFSCVFGAATGRPWLGIGAAALWLGLHVPRRPHPGRELILILAAAALGVVVDLALVRGGVLRYASPGSWEGFGPLWMVALWMGFATTLNVSLEWLQRRPLTSLAMGVVFGPLAYLGGQRLGGVTFIADHTAGLTAVAVAWAVALPLLTSFAGRLNTATGSNA